MLRSALFAAAALVASPAWSDGCPQAPDHTAALDQLFDDLQAATTEAEARPISGAMWQLWLDAPDPASQAMLDAGLRARVGRDFARALDRFEALVNYCPFYAEGYNQRAFVHFLTGAYDRALPDLDRTLDINPRHVGALSGKALTLLRLGRQAEAQAALRAAVALNPWLAERALLDETEEL